MAQQLTRRARRQLVVFGDSLSDEGTFGFRFTTLPGHTWAYHVARHLGCNADPAIACNYADAFLGRTAPSHIGAGLNFAQGGARVRLPYSAVSQQSWGIPWPATRQLDAFLATHRRFSDDQVVAVFAGTNDVTYRYDPAIDPVVAAHLRENTSIPSRTMASERRRVSRAANDLVLLVQRARAAGASLVLVFNLFDLAHAPWFRTAAARDYIAMLTADFNVRLRKGVALPNDGSVRFVDTAAVLRPILVDPQAHGFVRSSGADACADTGADCVDFCHPHTQVTPSAHRDHLFAAGLHLSTAGHEVLARHVIEQHLGHGGAA